MNKEKDWRDKGLFAGIGLTIGIPIGMAVTSAFYNAVIHSLVEDNTVTINETLENDPTPEISPTVDLESI